MTKGIYKINRILFPKNVTSVEAGEYAILSLSLVKHISGKKPKLHPVYENISAKGNVPIVKQGQKFTMTLTNAEESKFGTTYTIENVVKEVDPKNKKDLLAYLTFVSGATTAKEMIKVENIYELLKTQNSEELLKIKGIGENRLNHIYETIAMYTDYSYAYAKLIPLGLTEKQIKKIALKCGGASSAVEICTTNPYRLIEKVKGIGFMLADQIALKCGIGEKDKIRIEHAVLYTLEVAGESGKSFLTASQLLPEIKRIVDVEFEEIINILQEMNDKNIIRITDGGKEIALTKYINLEEAIAKELIRIRDAKSSIVIPSDWRETITDLEEEQGWKYTDEQMYGIESVLFNNLVAISGKAGSGKSSITNAMCEILDDYDIVLCCLSAKASQRLREVTGRDSMTIHRAIGLGVGSEKFNKLLADIIILDEASMVNGGLFLKLLQATKTGAKLIVLGDDGQLTSIGNCAVFKDMLHSENIRNVALSKIHRQAQKSAIITKSIDIRNQKQVYPYGFRGHETLGELQDLELFIEEENDNLFDLACRKFVEDYNKVLDILEVQVITGVKNRGNINVKKLNLALQQIYLQPKGISIKGMDDVNIFVNDKVINTENNYSIKNVYGDATPVFNGSIGIVKKIQEDSLIIDFMGIGEVVFSKVSYQVLNLAYAITCHSAQGSQWHRVINVLDMTSYLMLNVEMLYTAITRASKHCSLIIQDKAFQQCLRTLEQSNKQTFLPMFLSCNR